VARNRPLNSALATLHLTGVNRRWNGTPYQHPCRNTLIVLIHLSELFADRVVGTGSPARDGIAIVRHVGSGLDYRQKGGGNVLDVSSIQVAPASGSFVVRGTPRSKNFPYAGPRLGGSTQ